MTTKPLEKNIKESTPNGLKENMSSLHLNTDYEHGERGNK